MCQFMLTGVLQHITGFLESDIQTTFLLFYFTFLNFARGKVSNCCGAEVNIRRWQLFLNRFEHLGCSFNANNAKVNRIRYIR